ncbi:DUF6083 domain-containing protein [Streptomyces sp. NPDC014864]|uniref:DUF6083 domain-containing protein n=1 Tax=Streptomyces sp. NPDC014864 TaxID=3364924 RepID=UPI0036FDF063
MPAEHRWIELSDGRVTVYGVCPPDPFQRCRIEHRLACSAQRLPALWPWLTMPRGENGRHAERQLQAEPETARVSGGMARCGVTVTWGGRAAGGHRLPGAHQPLVVRPPQVKTVRASVKQLTERGR